MGKLCQVHPPHPPPSVWLNSHIVDLYVAVVRGCDQQLRVWGEGERPDGHGVTCRTGQETVTHTHTLTHSTSPSVSAGFTFQRVEQLPSGDVKDVDDSIDGTARQILSIRTLRTDKKAPTEGPRDTQHWFSTGGSAHHQVARSQI